MLLGGSPAVLDASNQEITTLVEEIGELAWGPEKLTWMSSSELPAPLEAPDVPELTHESGRATRVRMSVKRREVGSSIGMFSWVAVRGSRGNSVGVVNDSLVSCYRYLRFWVGKAITPPN